MLGLRGLHIERTGRDILGHLGRLQGDLADFQDDYATLGTHIGHAARKYEEANRKLTKLDEKLQLTGETPITELPERSPETRDQEE